jgi:hypothetical protein
MEMYAITLPHNSQRYDTCGDYLINDDIYRIRISDLRNEDYHFMILIHEMIEAYLTNKRGIKESDITKFDTEYVGPGEPGDSENAPYRNEHIFATKIERLCCDEIGCDWKAYDCAVRNL